MLKLVCMCMRQLLGQKQLCGCLKLNLAYASEFAGAKSYQDLTAYAVDKTHGCICIRCHCIMFTSCFIHDCRGEIPAQFKLLPFENSSASKFSFRPTEGTLDVGEVKTIHVQLQSDLLGVFSDTFCWSLNGSSDALKLQFKGSIVGPKFRVRFHDKLDCFYCLAYIFPEELCHTQQEQWQHFAQFWHHGMQISYNMQLIFLLHF